MNHPTCMADVRGATRAVEAEAAALMIGAVFTFALFFGLARFENIRSTEPAAEIEDLRMAAIQFEPPPPPPKLEDHARVPEEVLPFSGLEIGAAESPVSIAIVPPDLEALIPATSTPPPARIQFGLLHSELKPKLRGAEIDLRHVYQVAEVDQKPRTLVRTVPLIPPDVKGRAETLHVELLLLVGVDGKLESARVAQSSGNPRFDAIVAHTVRTEWLFSPAIRRGQKVRVLAQQSFRINFTTGGSPYNLD